MDWELSDDLYENFQWLPGESEEIPFPWMLGLGQAGGAAAPQGH